MLLTFGALACEAPTRPSSSGAGTSSGSSLHPPRSGPRRAAPAAAIAHAGAGTPPERAAACRAAVDAALAALAGGAEPIDAAVAGVVVMEDDPHLNAGTGSRVRLDGVTVQMDASVMDSAGRFGAVAVIERVKNPVKVARALLDTPHLVLAGEGATAFARTLGMEDYDPTTEESKEASRRIQEKLMRADPSLPARWQGFDYRSRWNFERSLAEAGLDPRDAGTDTVGVAVRAADGRFASALSTGGTSITLRGRVGDVPVFGAGLFAGRRGAVAATGTGERIIEESVGRSVHGFLQRGEAPDAAAKRVVERIRGKGSIGVIAIGPSSMGAAADRPMAWAGREAGHRDWLGPSP